MASKTSASETKQKDNVHNIMQATVTVTSAQSRVANVELLSEKKTPQHRQK